MHLEGTTSTSTQETQIETRDLMCPICMSKNKKIIYLKIIFNHSYKKKKVSPKILISHHVVIEYSVQKMRI
jgi:hypothetical protein